MNCLSYIELIAAKLDGALSGPELRELDRHLAGCPRCRAELLLQKKIAGALAEDAPSPLPADFTRRVSKQVMASNRRRRLLSAVPVLIPALPLVTGILLTLVFRNAIARMLPPALESLTMRVAAPLASLGASLAESIQTGHVAYRSMTLTVASASLGLVAVLWAFRRVRAFLAE